MMLELAAVRQQERARPASRAVPLVSQHPSAWNRYSSSKAVARPPQDTEKLPIELGILIAKELPTRDICRLQQTCKAFYDLLEGDSELWRERTAGTLGIVTKQHYQLGISQGISSGMSRSLPTIIVNPFRLGGEGNPELPFFEVVQGNMRERKPAMEHSGIGPSSMMRATVISLSIVPHCSNGADLAPIIPLDPLGTRIQRVRQHDTWRTREGLAKKLNLGSNSDIILLHLTRSSEDSVAKEIMHLQAGQCYCHPLSGGALEAFACRKRFWRGGIKVKAGSTSLPGYTLRRDHSPSKRASAFHLSKVPTRVEVATRMWGNVPSTSAVGSENIPLNPFTTVLCLRSSSTALDAQEPPPPAQIRVLGLRAWKIWKSTRLSECSAPRKSPKYTLDHTIAALVSQKIPPAFPIPIPRARSSQTPPQPQAVRPEAQDLFSATYIHLTCQSPTPRQASFYSISASKYRGSSSRKRNSPFTSTSKWSMYCQRVPFVWETSQESADNWAGMYHVWMSNKRLYQSGETDDRLFKVDLRTMRSMQLVFRIKSTLRPKSLSEKSVVSKKVEPQRYILQHINFKRGVTNTARRGRDESRKNWANWSPRVRYLVYAMSMRRFDYCTQYGDEENENREQKGERKRPIKLSSSEKRKLGQKAHDQWRKEGNPCKREGREGLRREWDETCYRRRGKTPDQAN
ncbi:hypothetical protein DFP72DRAFT_1050509 [Ephemerocybe angulata]|uniref:F-box domain-containing protein n=1 Tax=Ephemerocybe angulata TaxID=980116 RepID=A0A8H6LXY1_9AGAR|nr:hypothetical protein DFP72DRAFT_1050509 [Tulosesus angulatus]